MLTGLLTVLSVLVLAGWWIRRRHLRQTLRGRRPVATDDVLREIRDEASVNRAEEGLDEEEIRQAEDRFWEEAEWDDPEEYG
jgi:hypothetical protein